MKTIPEIMLRDHARIHNLAGEIERRIKTNLEDAEHLFIRLKWSLEKHFFVEEKVIFTVYESSGPVETEDLNNLLKEHRDILLLVRKIDDSFKNKNIHKLFEELKKVLLDHANFEDDVFYPRLDEELSDKEKQVIYDRCEGWV